MFKIGVYSIAITPSETIIDLMMRDHISEETLREKLNLSNEQLRRLIDDYEPMTEELAEGLEALFGAPKSLWLGLDIIYRKDAETVRKEIRRSREKEEIFRPKRDLPV